MRQFTSQPKLIGSKISTLIVTLVLVFSSIATGASLFLNSVAYAIDDGSGDVVDQVDYDNTTDATDAIITSPSPELSTSDYVGTDSTSLETELDKDSSLESHSIDNTVQVQAVKADVVTVNTEQELVDAVKSGGPSVIEIGGNITTTSRVNISRSLTINGNGKTISPKFSKTSNSNNAAIGISGAASTVTINNLIVDGSDGSSLHGINVYVSNAVLSDVTIKNFKKGTLFSVEYGLIINGSRVIVNNITTSGNDRGVNVDRGSGVEITPLLTINGRSSHGESIAIYVDSGNKSYIVDTNSQYDTTKGTTQKNYKLKAAPTAPVITAPSEDQILDSTLTAITWDKVADAATYDVEINDKVVATGLTNEEYKTEGWQNKLANKQTHKIRVRAVAASGLTSDWSAVRTVKVDFERYDPIITAVDVKVDDGDYKTFNENDFLSGEVTFRLTIEGNHKSTWLSAHTITDSTSYLDSSSTISDNDPNTTDEVYLSFDTTTGRYPDGLYQLKIASHGAEGSDGYYGEMLSFGVANVTPATPTGGYLQYENSSEKVDQNARYTSIQKREAGSELLFGWSQPGASQITGYEITVLSPNNDKKVFTTSDTSSSTWSIDANDAFGWDGGGEYTYQVVALNGVKRSSYSYKVGMTYDNTAPDIELVSPSNGATTKGERVIQSWSTTASDIDHFVYESWHDEDMTSLRWRESFTATSKTATKVADATYYWRVKAVDKAGNESDFTSLWKLTVDSTAPVVPALVSPIVYLNNENNNNGVEPRAEVKWTHDGADVDHFEYHNYYDNEAAAEADTTGSAGASYNRYSHERSQDIEWSGYSKTYYRIVAVDAAGNRTASEVGTIIIDNAAPVVEINNTTPKATYKIGDTINVHVIDSNFSRVEIDRTDSAAPANDRHWVYNGAWFGLAWLKDGTYKLTAYDKAGNFVEYSFITDKTKPVVTGSEESSINPTSLTITATDASSGIARVTGNIYKYDPTHAKADAEGYYLFKSNSSASEDIFTIQLSDLIEGTYYVRYNASDIVGNISNTERFDFIVDNTAPTVSITNFSDISISGTTDTDAEQVEVFVNDNSVGIAVLDAGIWTFDFAAGLNDNDQVYAIATDKAGNQTVSEIKTYVISGSGEARADGTESNTENILAPVITTVPATIAGLVVTVNADDGTAVLGESTDNQPVSESSDDNGEINGATTVAAVTDGQWDGKLLGLQWYWWLLILAGIGILWWIIAAIRRRRDDDKA